ncbi:hypothetical protein X980_6253 [Burkholderia pseudomallei MSHR4000]|nr:hypothetical protein X980_6253 [Burkholderia pseudomallei MSHR4000]
MLLLPVACEPWPVAVLDSPDAVASCPVAVLLLPVACEPWPVAVLDVPDALAS